jgi:hypothetical protein
MTFLSFSLSSDLLVVLHGILDLNFKLCAFIINGFIKGEIEKPSGQYLSLSCRGLNSNLGHFDYFTFIICFVWKITFACLVVCRWQVQHDDNDKDRGKSRTPDADDRGWSRRSSTRWLDDREVG